MEVLEALSAIHAEASFQAAADRESHSYTFVSVRSLADRLGFTRLLPEILWECQKEGFDYCLDRTVACRDGVGGSGSLIYPDQDVCMWGADQLASRLSWVLPYQHRRGDG